MKKSILLKIFIFQFSFFNFLSCADWFENKVSMNTDSNNVTLEDLFYSKKAIDSLDSPKQVIVSQGLYAGKIEVSWSEVENATSYRVERAIVKKDANGGYQIPDESEFETRVGYCYSTTFTDTILSNPKENNSEYENHYFYRVCAVNYSLSLESDPSEPSKDETRAEGWLFSTPKNVDATKGKSTSEIKITWEKSEGATSYKIYRGERENGTGMEVIDSVNGNQFSYTNAILSSEQGTEFYYKIVAQNSNGNDSAFSSIAMGYSLKEGAPSTPDNLKVVDGLAKSTSNFIIQWDEVSAAKDGVTITYALYKNTSEDSVFTLVKNNLTTTTYTDSSNLKTGITYYYYIQAIADDNGEKLKSAFSDKSQDAHGYLLSPSSDLSVEDIEGNTSKVNLVWQKAVGFDEVNFVYNIYTSSDNENYSLTYEKVTGTENENGYLVYKVDKANFYKISTVNELLSESVLSYAVAPTPSAPKNVTATKTKLLDSDFSPNKNNVYPVKVYWEKPDDDNPSSYNVYRSTKADSGFRKITDSPITETEFTDINDTAKSGVFYYYKVVSLNSLGQGKKGNNPSDDLATANGSNFSSIKSIGYGALTREQWFREYNKTVMNSQKKLTLMHKPVDTDKLGKESVNGNISGTLSYDAHLKGLGAEIIMPYKNYCDYHIKSDSSLSTSTEDTLSAYFVLTGNNDTTSNMSGNGNMSGTVKCSGMYPGNSNYSKLEIKGGAAGGGSYGVTTFDLEENVILEEGQISWLIGEEGR